MPYINTKEEPCLFTHLTGTTNVGTKRPREKDTPNKESERGDFTHLQYMLHVVVLCRCVYMCIRYIYFNTIWFSLAEAEAAKRKKRQKGEKPAVLAEKKGKENVARKQTTKAKAKGKTTCPDILS